MEEARPDIRGVTEVSGLALFFRDPPSLLSHHGNYLFKPVLPGVTTHRHNLVQTGHGTS